jgi:hypothetical protein
MSWVQTLVLLKIIMIIKSQTLWFQAHCIYLFKCIYMLWGRYLNTKVHLNVIQGVICVDTCLGLRPTINIAWEHNKSTNKTSHWNALHFPQGRNWRTSYTVSHKYSPQVLLPMHRLWSKICLLVWLCGPCGNKLTKQRYSP